MSGYRIPAALWDRIHHFASFPQTGVSLQQMVLFGQNPSQGTLFKASQFLAEELPIRLAHRCKELDSLPHSLSKMPSIKKVRNWYAQSFQELVTFPKYNPPPEVKKMLYASNGDTVHKFPESIPNPSLSYLNPIRSGRVTHNPERNGNSNGGVAQRLRIPIERRYYDHAGSVSDAVWPPELHDYNSRFTRTLETIKRRHDPTVTTVAQGVLEWKTSPYCNTRHIGLDVQAWLDRFYMSRIGIRFLIGQHIALNTLEPHPDYVGIICTRANVHDIVHEAIENARFVCEEHYSMFQGPPVQLICAPDLTFAYVPGHLSHICFELLKNSLRAVVERFGAMDVERLPAIKVIVSEGKEDITIKISDEGGGIPRSAIPLIWTYMYTTMQGQDLHEDFTDTDFKAPMAGFGYGLPLSRLVSTDAASVASSRNRYSPENDALREWMLGKRARGVHLVDAAALERVSYYSARCLEPLTQFRELQSYSYVQSRQETALTESTEEKCSEVANIDKDVEKLYAIADTMAALDIDSRKAYEDQEMHLLTNKFLSLQQYARYFGGDLKLISMEGYGTDVYIHLNRLSSSCEPLQ